MSMRTLVSFVRSVCFATPNQVTQVAIVLDESDREAAFQERARGILARALPDVPLEVLTWQDRDPTLAALVGQMGNMGWIVYILVFVATAFGIANARLMSVYERIREFGVMRSLGLHGSRVVSMVLTESVVITSAGTAIGLVFGLSLTLWLSDRGMGLVRDEYDLEARVRCCRGRQPIARAAGARAR